jgi:sortase A
MATWRPISLSPTDRWGPLPPHAGGRPPRRGLARLERLLLVIGIVCVGAWLYVSLEATLYQRLEDRELDAVLRSKTPPAATAASPAVSRRLPAGTVIGRVEIPRLGVSTIVRAGTDARTLRLAIGHIEGTALPGDRGNVGLAGHRDTFFRRLRDIRHGDRIRFVTPGGTFTYRVARTDIVWPSDVWVLDETADAVLTLVTCYPFSYVGSAPQRFIVRAELL